MTPTATISADHVREVRNDLLESTLATAAETLYRDLHKDQDRDKAALTIVRVQEALELVRLLGTDDREPERPVELEMDPATVSHFIGLYVDIGQEIRETQEHADQPEPSATVLHAAATDFLRQAGCPLPPIPRS